MGTLLVDLADAAADAPGKLSPYNVGSLAWGYARLCVHPGDRLLQVTPVRTQSGAFPIPSNFQLRAFNF